MQLSPAATLSAADAETAALSSLIDGLALQPAGGESLLRDDDSLLRQIFFSVLRWVRSAGLALQKGISQSRASLAAGGVGGTQQAWQSLLPSLRGHQRTEAPCKPHGTRRMLDSALLCNSALFPPVQHHAPFVCIAPTPAGTTTPTWRARWTSSTRCRRPGATATTRVGCSWDVCMTHCPVACMAGAHAAAMSVGMVQQQRRGQGWACLFLGYVHTSSCCLHGWRPCSSRVRLAYHSPAQPPLHVLGCVYGLPCTRPHLVVGAAPCCTALA